MRGKPCNYCLACILAAALLLVSGCGRKRARVTPPPLSPRAAAGYTEDGIASWYGHPYHGRKTANGETYDMDLLTAAHKTLPFGVWVEVRNKRNAQSVTVRINDRGPFIEGRIIDLSRAAARKIDLIRPGTAPVRIKVIRTP